MHRYQHILIALNYTHAAEHVLAKAQQLTQAYQAQLSLVHVLDDIAMPDTTYGTCIALDKVTDYQALEHEKQRLLNAATNIGLSQQHCWLIWGSPQQEILRLAERLQVDLIVVGAHKSHGLGFLLGSTADSLLHHATCDILAVHLED